jgi:hypothetical protein
MAKSFRLLAAALVLGVMSAGAADAGIPDPNLSVVPNVLYVPGGTLEYVVQINGAQGPVVDVVVDIVFSAEADGLICWCATESHPQISATTDSNGEAHFFINAGGCIDPSQIAGPAVATVYADGIKMADVGAVSPDAVDANGVLPTAGWVPGGICVVGLADAGFHTPPVKSGAYSFCTDLNSDGAIGLDDASILTPAVKAGASCSQ